VFVIYAFYAARYSIQHTPTPPTLGRFDLIEIGAVVAFGFFWFLLTIYFPSGLLGGLAADRGWCPHAWERILIGLAVAAIVAPVPMVLVFKLLSIINGRPLPPFPVFSVFILPALIGNAGWALAFYLDSDADDLLRVPPNGPETDTHGLKSEAFKLAWAAARVFAFGAAIGISSLIIDNAITADTLRRGSHGVVLPSPTARPT